MTVYSATITPTRFGFRAEVYSVDRLPMPDGSLPFPLSFEIGGPIWRFRRSAVERAVDRRIRRREVEDQWSAKAYRYTPGGAL